MCQVESIIKLPARNALNANELKVCLQANWRPDTVAVAVAARLAQATSIWLQWACVSDLLEGERYVMPNPRAG